MKKSYLALILMGVLVLGALFISGCTTCNKPYILVGDSCCLDQDDNSICDNDEIPNPLEENKTCEEILEENSEFVLSQNTESGMTIYLYGYKSEKKGEDWGEITELTYGLYNQGSAIIHPDLSVSVFGRTESSNSQKVPLSIYLERGDCVVDSVPLSLSFSILNKTSRVGNDTKTLRVNAVESYGRYLVGTQLTGLDFSNQGG